jgi:parvulin-like peptidyl-prolyl isomerase
MKLLLYLILIFTLASCGAKRTVENPDATYNVSYIFLDGSKLSKDSIDMRRAGILSEFKAGANFKSLIDKYNMDGNPKADTFEFTRNGIVPEFTDGVTSHRPGEIFTIDVPSRKWYYVVLRNKNRN